ncbi:lamin-B receptor [Bactrocera tryoni]|uniref:lamin-B receptor n=1 Tax=Bactrocera tryoni TaxID=59916 RepID=UPI001A96F9E2|nr:lamin-B receptor [Bactrocera tryoni]XP_039953732.1 lamin-B receptor [Bactrocera tryoni]
MEGRRTRGRPKRKDVSVSLAATEKPSTTSTHINVPTKRSTSKTNVSPARRASPGRTRRSSRPRTSIVSSAPSTTTILIRSSPEANPSPIKELKETPSPKTTTSKTRIPSIVGSNLNTGGRSSPRFAAKSTSSIHSTYSSSSTQKTIEIRSTTSALDNEFQKLSDYIRRSVSKAIDGDKREGTHTPTTNTELESRYSRSVSRSIFDDGASSKAEFSDNETNGRTGEDDEEEEEEIEEYKSFNVTSPHSYSTSAIGKNCRELEIPREFGGWIGATLLMTVAPCLVYYLQWCCQKNSCELKMPYTDIYSVKMDDIWNSIFYGEAIIAFLIFNVGVITLSLLLCGRYVYLPTERTSPYYRLEYTFNGLPIAIIITLALGYIQIVNKGVIDFLLYHQLQFCVYSFITAFILGFWAYLRSLAVVGRANRVHGNLYGRTGNFLVDYALGRQVNPKWLDFIDFKLVFYRMTLLITLVYVECYLIKIVTLPDNPPSEDGIWSVVMYYYNNTRYDSAALLTSGMLLVYIWDALIFEHHLASSFELQSEGFGALLLLRYGATPHLLTAVARYFFEQQLDRNVQMSTPLSCCLAAYIPIALLIAGLLLKRISSAVKYKYRVNPTNPYFDGIETIHTYQGRRLLLGPLWGRLRHPNYAGELLALCALAIPLFVRFAWPPLICILLLCIVLLHRTQRLQARNMSRYHSSWVRYCNKARYYILPKVY